MLHLRPLLCLMMFFVGLAGCSQSTSEGPPVGTPPIADGGTVVPQAEEPTISPPASPTGGDPGRTKPVDQNAQPDPGVPKAAATPDEVLKQAGEIIQTGDVAAVIRFLEGAATEPDTDARILLTLAQAYNAQAMQFLRVGNEDDAKPLFLKAGTTVRKYLKAEPKPSKSTQDFISNTVYNEACAHALEGNKKAALASIKMSLEMGFSDLELVKSDESLESIQGEAEFKSLVAAAEVAVREREVAQVKTMMDEFEGFPFTFALPDVDGKTVSLEQHKGKVVIVDIWGTWCPPCREEIPHFIELRNKFQKQGLEIVGLNYERGNAEEAPDKIRDFVAENKMNYTCLIGDDETRQQVPDFQGYPTTLFIDRSGKVRLTFVGLQPYARLETVVQQLLAEGS